MTIVQAVEGIAAWINEKVCPRISFKKASDTVQDAGYAFAEAHPRAFPMFYPGKDKLPAGEDRAEPFILVTPVKGVRNALQGKQTLTVQLTFRTWNPGTYGQELGKKTPFNPTSKGGRTLKTCSTGRSARSRTRDTSTACALSPPRTLSTDYW